jgi:hypothetical protein
MTYETKGVIVERAPVSSPVLPPDVTNPSSVQVCPASVLSLPIRMAAALFTSGLLQVPQWLGVHRPHAHPDDVAG